MHLSWDFLRLSTNHPDATKTELTTQRRHTVARSALSVRELLEPNQSGESSCLRVNQCGPSQLGIKWKNRTCQAAPSRRDDAGPRHRPGESCEKSANFTLPPPRKQPQPNSKFSPGKKKKKELYFQAKHKRSFRGFLRRNRSPSALQE